MERTFRQVVEEIRDLKVYSMRVETHREGLTKVLLYGFGDRPEGVNGTPTWNSAGINFDPDVALQDALVSGVENRDGVSLRAAQRAFGGNYDLVESEPKPGGLSRPKKPQTKLSSADLANLLGL